jgi:hypothetical protein
MSPEPIWPLIVLAAVTAVDGVLCLKPVAFIAQCFTDVRFPRRHWPIISPIKFAAVAGLIAGIWIPLLALLTTCCLIAYFVVAIVMHFRARDLGRNLFVNAFGMLMLCFFVLGACFLW